MLWFPAILVAQKKSTGIFDFGALYMVRLDLFTTDEHTFFRVSFVCNDEVSVLTGFN